MDICFEPLVEGDVCSPDADGYCHCGDDPDCSYTSNGQRITVEDLDTCDRKLVQSIMGPGRAFGWTNKRRLYFAHSPECQPRGAQP